MILKILQVRLQQCMNHKLPDVQVSFRKGRGTRVQIANILWITEKTRESTCVPHPDPPSHLPLHPLPLGFPSAPGPSACLMHPMYDKIHYKKQTNKQTRESQKNIYFCFIDYTKAFDCVDHGKLWKILQEVGIQDRFTYLLMKGCC